MRRLTAEEFRREFTKIVEQLKEYHPQKAILFGSFARGNYHGMSDADMLIVKETDKPFLSRIGEALKMLERVMELVSQSMGKLEA